jgi:hypothetical protein
VIRDRVWDGTIWRAVGGANSTGAAERSTLVAGAYIPGLTPNTVGTLAGTTFTEVTPTTGVTITLPPGTYTAQRYWGNVTLSGSGTYNFVNCRFAGHDPSVDPGAYNGMFLNLSDTRTCTFTDCTFDGWEWNRVYGTTQSVLRSYSSTYVNMRGYVVSLGFKGRKSTFLRCEFVNLQDGIFVQGDDLVIQQCAIWKGQYMNGGVGSSSDGATHVDGVQYAYGLRNEVAYSLIGGRRIFDAYAADPPTDNQGEDCFNSAFMIQCEVNDGRTIGANIHHNWIGGGAASMNLSLKYGDYLTGVSIANNRILRRPATVASNGYRNDHQTNAAGSPGYYIVKNTTTPTITGNVIWDWNGSIAGTGTAVPVT